MRRLFFAPIALLTASICSGAELDAGTGFGESLAILTSAREAGTGRMPLEDRWRENVRLEASTIGIGSGLNWYGLGFQAGLGSVLRIGAEAFAFSADGIPQSLELPDGTFGGDSGTVDALEWGGRLSGQLTLVESARWRAAAVGRLNGIFQKLPSTSRSGLAAEMGVQVRRNIQGGRQAIDFWGLAGPVGQAASYTFSHQFLGGVGFSGTQRKGLLTRHEGYALGLEGSIVGEKGFKGGSGVVYWFGDYDGPGFTLFLRGGGQMAPGEISNFRITGGIGLLWRNASGWGLQVDYAVIPLDDLGSYSYATVGIKMPSFFRSVANRTVGQVS